MATENEKLYPHCDFNIWLRSCEKEITEPLEGKVTGEVPSWINGTLLRNGPGTTKVGDRRFKHIFDGSALLHKFAIKGGKVTYQCRFLRSESWERNRASNRIVFTEFGTAAVPDPCQTIFDRLASIFKISDALTDNSMISVCPFGDEVYALTEVPVIHRIDPESLETMERKNLDTFVVNHTAHPHVMPNGDVYNLGMAKGMGRVHNVIVKFPFTEKGDMFEEAHIVSYISPRWPLHPSYMHSFGITENYFVMIEQPLCLSLVNFVKNHIYTKDPIASCLRWFPDEETSIVLVNRKDGSTKRYVAENFAYFHIINCFETDDAVIVDVVAYKDAQLIQALYIEAIEGMQTNKEYASWCRSRPKRIEIPLDAPEMSRVDLRLLADISCETPRINYEKFNGRPYRYCYGTGMDADVTHAPPLVKLDVKSGTAMLWYEEGWSPGEPIFVAQPDAEDEDDGVILSAMLRECAPDSERARELALLVLDARDLREIARVTFRTPTPVPKTVHGWFLPA